MLNKFEELAWELSDEENEIYVPVIHKPTGHAVFIEVNSIKETKTINIFLNKDEATKYKESKEKHKVVLVKTKLKHLTLQMKKYEPSGDIPLNCVVSTYSVENALYRVYLLWSTLVS
jgi:hypothetical protein